MNLAVYTKKAGPRNRGALWECVCPCTSLKAGWRIVGRLERKDSTIWGKVDLAPVKP